MYGRRRAEGCGVSREAAPRELEVEAAGLIRAALSGDEFTIDRIVTRGYAHRTSNVCQSSSPRRCPVTGTRPIRPRGIHRSRTRPSSSTTIRNHSRCLRSWSGSSRPVQTNSTRPGAPGLRRARVTGSPQKREDSGGSPAGKPGGESQAAGRGSAPRRSCSASHASTSARLK